MEQKTVGEMIDDLLDIAKKHGFDFPIAIAEGPAWETKPLPIDMVMSVKVAETGVVNHFSKNVPSIALIYPVEKEEQNEN